MVLMRHNLVCLSGTKRKTLLIMKSTGRQRLIGTLVVIAACLVPFRQAFGYVDPGSGSYLLQLLVAALFGTLFTVRVFWARIKGLLGKITMPLFRRKQEPGEQ